MDKLLFLIFIFGVLLPSLCNVSQWGPTLWGWSGVETGTMRTAGMGTSPCPHGDGDRNNEDGWDGIKSLSPWGWGQEQ